MDDSVKAAMGKWPNVPACYGWLGLDRRGQWRLQGETVRHAGLEAFLNRNYGHDNAGNWFAQNGPQKVYVALDYTPWVLRLKDEHTLVTHTGLAVANIEQAFFDEEGNLLLVCEHGPALADDRDLPALLARIVDDQGQPAAEADLLALMEGAALPLQLRWQERSIPLRPLKRAEVAVRFGFIPAPAP
ncbi:MAG: DUF2946 family protein [Rhodocyclaceae bacterium]|nr:MAG: DUF2946 family protein [Rhodocyclaceae bacterium]